MASDPQLAFVVLIGTNNLGRGHTPEETVAGVVAVAGTLLNQTQGRVLLNALLPRGDGNKRKKAAPVVGSAADGSPVRSFSPLITKVNAGLRSWAEADAPRRVGTRSVFLFSPTVPSRCRRTRRAASGSSIAAARFGAGSTTCSAS